MSAISLNGIFSNIDIFGKYAWVVTLRDKKGSTITNAFQKNLDEYGRKSNTKYG